MKLRTTIMLAAAAGMVGMVQTAQADLASESATLAALESGGSLTVGDKTFTGFSYVADNLSSFNALGITVTATEVNPNYYTIVWGGNISVSVVGPTASPVVGDLLLDYTVTASGGPIGSIDQSYVGNISLGSAVVGSGTLSVAEFAYLGLGGLQVANSSLTTTLTSEVPPNTYPGANLIVNPPESSLYVTKDINLSIYTPTVGGVATATISQVEQSFEEVPEATTLIAGALLILPFGASALRILRRNRIS